MVMVMIMVVMVLVLLEWWGFGFQVILGSRRDERNVAFDGSDRVLSRYNGGCSLVVRMSHSANMNI